MALRSLLNREDGSGPRARGQSLNLSKVPTAFEIQSECLDIHRHAPQTRLQDLEWCLLSWRPGTSLTFPISSCLDLELTRRCRPRVMQSTLEGWPSCLCFSSSGRAWETEIICQVSEGYPQSHVNPFAGWDQEWLERFVSKGSFKKEQMIDCPRGKSKSDV